MALFTKSYEELREAFVCKRFNEEDYYGLANIEQWLERQRPAEHPDEERWNYCLSTTDALLFASHGRELQTLSECADPSPIIPQESPTEYDHEILHRARIAPLLLSFDPSKASIYYGHVHGMNIVCGHGSDAKGFALHEEHDANGKSFTTIKPLHPVDVIDAVFATWVRGGSKAAAARQFLCDALAEAIRRNRLQAEKDFDKAVAVSEDGRKIVHTDQVVVVHQDLTWKAYPPDFFQRHKILRSKSFGRDLNLIPCGSFAELIVWHHDKIGGRECDQALVRHDGHPDKTTFVTQARYCSELPPEEK